MRVQVLFRSTVCAACLFALAPARGDELVHADGRREVVREPRRDSSGRWTVEIEGRRVLLKPGDAVAVIDAEGRETDLVPTLEAGPLDANQAAALAELSDPRVKDWELAVEALASPPRRAAFDALVDLAGQTKPALRRRALGALARLRTRESVLVAAQRVLVEKDKATRRAAAAALFSAWEVYRRTDADQVTTAGIAHQDKEVRLTFALLAPRSFEAAAVVLRADGLGSSDHHSRESAAVELGKRGDASGESVLIGMLARRALPGVDDPELGVRLLVAEQVEVCAILGALRTEAGLAALEKARRSPHAAVREAAARATAAAGQGERP